MPANYGQLFNDMRSYWNGRPIEDRLKSRGITRGEDGRYFSGDGDSRAELRFDGSQAGYASPDAAAAFNPRDFVNQYHVLPLDSEEFNGNLKYTDAAVASQEMGSLDQYLRKMSGGSGEYVNDPVLGRVWVPGNGADFDIFRDFSKQRGGGLGGLVHKFADSGGFVKALGGAVGGAGLGDVWGNFFSGAKPPVDLPTGMDLAGDSLLQSTPLPPAPDPTWRVNGRELANPFTAPEIPEVYEKAINLKAGGSALNPSPFNLEDFMKKTPTTGNKLVDQLLTKAATSALGGANTVSAGEGGDTTAADQTAAEEARKQALIEQINAMYASDNFRDEDEGLSNAIRGQQGDALKLGYEKAARSTTFDAARRGNVGGSVMADNISNLNRDNQLGATKIEDAVSSALSGLRSSRLASQGNAISLVNAGSGPEAVDAAASGIRNAIDSARAAKVPDVTEGLFKNVALSNQAINTGNNTAALGAYINARNGGGGSLFPLGSGASGRNVPGL